MNKRATFFGLLLASTMLIGIGCGGNAHPTSADLSGKWNVDITNVTSENAKTLKGATVDFAEKTMTVNVEAAGKTAQLTGDFEEIPVGTEDDQAQANFALKFNEFTVKTGENEQKLPADQGPFQTVHVKFADDKSSVVLYDKKLDDTDAAKLVRANE